MISKIKTLAKSKTLFYNEFKKKEIAKGLKFSQIWILENITEDPSFEIISLDDYKMVINFLYIENLKL